MFGAGVWMLGFLLLVRFFFFGLFSSRATSEGKMQPSLLFLRGTVMELACVCLRMCLFAGQSSEQPRLLPL